MRDDEEETQRLRSVAVQNAQEVVATRRRLEQELLQAQAELHEQARVLELLNKTGTSSLQTSIMMGSFNPLPTR